jgi:DNA polymerase-1
MDRAKLPMHNVPTGSETKEVDATPKKVAKNKIAKNKIVTKTAAKAKGTSKQKKEKRKRLVLLDSHAIIHRAYHALPDFTTPTGEPSGALYGLSSMLLRIIAELKPDYIAACYDLPKPTLRHEVYADYKATRVKSDPALTAQLTSSRRVFEAFSIPIYEKEGFEADDILGTISHHFKDDPSIEIIIASGDMDTMQLIEKDRVKVYTLKKGITDTIMYDEKAVLERFGFEPELIPDYKGLRGDPSDNIIGIPGIGEKTATELIVQFGPIEKMYKTLKKDEKVFIEKGIKARIVGLLKEHEEDAVFSKMLATIRLDAPIDFELPDATVQKETLPKILEIFDEFGFRSIRARARAVFQDSSSEQRDANGEQASGIPGMQGMSAEIFEAPEEIVDPTQLQEAKVMLWLLASDFTNPSLDDVLAYTRADSFESAKKILEEKIHAEEKLEKVYETVEQPLMDVLRKMTEHGVLVDKKALATLAKKYHAELEGCEAKIYELAGREFLISSPRQLGDVLFDDLGLKAKGQKKTATGQRSTRESELEKIRELHPIVDAILEYRQIQKLLSTYIDSIPTMLDEHNRLHAEFLQTGTTTGRMASQNPNLQNIPIRSDRGRAIRDAFIAPEGFTLLALDYSQIELRLAAILSGDPLLGEIFRSGRDVHQEVAARVFAVPAENVDREMRRRAKIINFGILYGMGVNALRAQLGTTTSEAHQFYDDYFDTFSRLAEYLEEVKGFARKHGYTETLFGRRREFSGIKSPLPFVRAQAERMAINAPIQGTQADIIKLAMIEIDQMLTEESAQEDAHLLLQVHDELVFEVKNERVEDLAGKIKHIMESVLTTDQSRGIAIIAEAKIGKNWGEMEKLS